MRLIQCLWSTTSARMAGKVMLCVALLLSAAPLQAREVVGTAFVQGRTVELFSDGTWAFKGVTDRDGCSMVDGMVRLCDPDGAWRRSTGPDYGFDAIFLNNFNDNAFAALATQPYGSLFGNSFDGVIQHFIRGAAEMEGIPESTIPVFEVVDTTLSDLPAKRFSIAFPQNGLWQVNIYTVVVQPKASVYALTWAVGDESTAEMVDAHQDFTSKLIVTLGEVEQ